WSGRRSGERLGLAEGVARRHRLTAERTQLGGGRVQLADHAVVGLRAAELDARAIDLLDGAALPCERVHRHERPAHRGLRPGQLVGARDLERLSQRVERLGGVAAARAYVDETTL